MSRESLAFKILLCLSTACLYLPGVCEAAWGSSNRVRLGDVKTLTLTNGKMTTARRGSAVPQVKCVGGSAGCSAFTPHVIQCYNQGYDGRTYQWKCVADMDDRYTFGRTDVTCEGYDSPYDEHILAGSCGVEYTLELTEAGRRDKGSGDSWSSGHSYDKHSGSGWGGNFIIMIVVCILIYAIYRTCVAQEHLSTSYNADDYPSDNPTPGGGAPPPYGFHPDYTQRQPPPPRGFRPNYTQRQPPPPQDTCGQPRTESPGLGGFWTGAATGGLLGYMFGNRSQGDTYYGRTQPGSGWRSSSPTYTHVHSTGTTGGPSPERHRRREATGFGTTIMR